MGAYEHTCTCYVIVFQKKCEGLNLFKCCQVLEAVQAVLIIGATTSCDNILLWCNTLELCLSIS